MTNSMIDEKPDNPPAFPMWSKCSTAKQDAAGNIRIEDAGYHSVGGMSLRDYFAAAALQGMLASGHQAPLEQLTVAQGGKPADGVALAAYGFADALLKARRA